MVPDGSQIANLILALIRVYGYPSVELRPGGGDESVTVHNVEEFVERTVDWALYRSHLSILVSHSE